VKNELLAFDSVADTKIMEAAPDAKEKTNVRKYGLQECCDAA
jgi:hypothetical protein